MGAFDPLTPSPSRTRDDKQPTQQPTPAPAPPSVPGRIQVGPTDI